MYNAGEPRKTSRNRKRKILWFNPPYNSTVKSNIGKDFLKLIDKCFPPWHPLRQIVNKNTVKVSYSCTPNMERIIASRNSKLFAVPSSAERTCNCPRNTPCPLYGKCLLENVVYEAKVTQDDQTQNCYTGLCSTTFKTRFGIRKNSLKTKKTTKPPLANLSGAWRRKIWVS